MSAVVRAAAVAAVIAIVVLVGIQLTRIDDSVGASPSSSRSVEPSRLASADSSPPAETSDVGLVLRLLGAGEAGRVHLVTIMDGGLVITTSPDGEGGTNPPGERRLTPVGIQLIRDELAATGLTDASADYNPVPNQGVEDVGYGGAGPSLEVGLTGGGTAVITWYLFADPPEQDFMQPQPEAEALDALATRLSTLEAWLPASAWADASVTP